MKQSPELQRVQERMQPGRLARDGLLGHDRRSLQEILDEDANTVSRLGLTHQRIADRLAKLLEEGRKGLGTTVTVEDHIELTVRSIRGVLPCPWDHPGVYPKENCTLKNLKTGEELTWTALSVHMIREHGFYEGKGATFRVDPSKAKSALEL